MFYIRALLKKILFEELYVAAAYKLKGHIIMGILPEVVSKAADMVETAQSAGCRDDWIDRVIGEIHKEQEHYKLIQNARTLKTQLEEQLRISRISKNRGEN